MQILHNPRCTKSRQTLQLLQDKGLEPEIILYLKEPPTADLLRDLLAKLDIPAAKLIRRGEAIYKEEFKGRDLSEEEWIAAMVEYPKLIERPIVFTEEKAAIGRPPEAVLDIL